MFCEKNTAHTTRSKDTNLMKLPKVRTNLGRQAFSHNGPAHRYKLPSQARQITGKTELRTAVTKVTNGDVDHPTCN